MAKPSTVQKSASTEIKTSPTTGGSTTLCCGGHCFGPKKRWSDSASGQMSEVYCRACDTQAKLVEANDSDASGDSVATITGAAESSTDDNIDSPACLANITPKRRAGSKTKPAANVLTIESELEIPSGKGLLKSTKSSSTTPKSLQQKKASTVKAKKTTTVPKAKITKTVDNLNGCNNNKKIEEYEWADDATAFDAAELPTTTEKLHRKVGVLNAIESKLMIRVQGTEELPARQQTTVGKKTLNGSSKQHLPSVIDNKLKTHSIASSSLKSSSSNRSKIISTNSHVSNDVQPPVERSIDCDDHNGNDGSRLNRLNRNYSTLPKMKRNGNQPLHAGHERPMKKIPMRTTPDGTNIYYWCDMSKRAIKGLVFFYFSFILLKIGVGHSHLKKIFFLFRFRTGRRCIQSTMGNAWLYTNISFLEGASPSAVNAAQRFFDLRHVALVEHCQRYVFPQILK